MPEIVTPQRILFITLMEEKYSRTWNYYRALELAGVDCSYVQLNSDSLIRNLWKIKKMKLEPDVKIIVGSASQMLVLPIRIIMCTKVYLDAGWSLVESTLVNRERQGIVRWRVVKNYLIDFVASILSTKIFVESHAQKDWYENHFPFTKGKCLTLYTGLDEEEFAESGTRLNDRTSTFKVIFRGKDNDEAGLRVLSEASHILIDENIKFVILSKPREIVGKFSSNTLVIQDYFKSKKEIASHYMKSDLSLGQLSGHIRLERTIPHKAYESAYLGIPYLTARNRGILEVFSEGQEVFCFEPDSATDLAEKILFLSKNRELLSQSSKKLKTRYEQDLSQRKLAEKLLDYLNVE